jgi:ABC-type Fe3+/spermidine/putrescine transport system ATPase subunit
VATFLGAANILEAVVRDDYLEIGSTRVAAEVDREKFQNGSCVKVVFRPEDVSLSRSDFLKPGQIKVSSGVVEEISFVGAYERVRLKLEPNGGDTCNSGETPYYLTTQTPEAQKQKSIIATRPKPEASATRLSIGDRVVVAITSYTVLPSQENKNGSPVKSS